jgi:hypothetical protein
VGEIYVAQHSSPTNQPTNQQTSGVLGVLAITHSSTATTPPTFEVLTLILLILPESQTHYLHTQNTYVVVVTYPKHYGGNCMCNG